MQFVSDLPVGRWRRFALERGNHCRMRFLRGRVQCHRKDYAACVPSEGTPRTLGQAALIGFYDLLGAMPSPLAL